MEDVTKWRMTTVEDAHPIEEEKIQKNRGANFLSGIYKNHSGKTGGGNAIWTGSR